MFHKEGVLEAVEIGDTIMMIISKFLDIFFKEIPGLLVRIVEFIFDNISGVELVLNHLIE